MNILKQTIIIEEDGMIHTVKKGEMLWTISEDYRRPIQAIIAANPGINPDTINVGQKLVIPGYPNIETISYSINVSLSNRTLTLMKQGVIQKTYPVGVGRVLHTTPVGDFIIINKQENPGGPFGVMWMGLSKKSYGIHGTNDESSIGHYVSLGCIRMHNVDVLELSKIVPVGTPVSILQ